MPRKRRTRESPASRFLDSNKRSRDVLGYVHMGGRYQDHEILSVMRVVDRAGDPIPGRFAVKVVYDWSTSFGDNSTTAIFFFDELGMVVDVKADTTSIISQPFAIASATINVLGNLLLETLGDQMKPDDRREFQKFVNASDAKGLLIWSLNFQSRLGV